MTREEAISVLKVLASFQGVMEYLEQHSVSVQDACNMAIKALSQEPCDDAISRQYLLDNCVVDKATMPYVPVNKIKNAPPVTQKPIECDDAISREAVIKDFTPLHNGEITLESAIDYLHKTGWMQEHDRILSERQSGKWIRVTDKTGHLVWECDKCSWQQRLNTNFCPDCGAKMIEPQERSRT